MLTLKAVCSRWRARLVALPARERVQLPIRILLNVLGDAHSALQGVPSRSRAHRVQTVNHVSGILGAVRSGAALWFPLRVGQRRA